MYTDRRKKGPQDLLRGSTEAREGQGEQQGPQETAGGMAGLLQRKREGEDAVSLWQSPVVQAAAAENEQREGYPLTPGQADRVERARQGGVPLDEGTRGQMEGAFGQDLSGVRVHADPEADALCRQTQARAFATGQDIFFRTGRYEPQTQEGQHLLAHELTHVLGHGPEKGVQRMLDTDAVQPAGPAGVDQAPQSAAAGDQGKAPVCPVSYSCEVDVPPPEPMCVSTDQLPPAGGPGPKQGGTEEDLPPVAGPGYAYAYAEPGEGPVSAQVQRDPDDKPPQLFVSFDGKYELPSPSLFTLYTWHGFQLAFDNLKYSPGPELGSYRLETPTVTKLLNLQLQRNINLYRNLITSQVKLGTDGLGIDLTVTPLRNLTVTLSGQAGINQGHVKWDFQSLKVGVSF